MSDHLTVAEVLAMHADQIERYGGSHGVRDQGLLEAALYHGRPGYYADLDRGSRSALGKPRAEPSLYRRQQAYGFRCNVYFLAINGARLTAGAQQTHVFIGALYEANQFNFDKLVPWLRSHVTQNLSADQPG